MLVGGACVIHIVDFPASSVIWHEFFLDLDSMIVFGFRSPNTNPNEQNLQYDARGTVNEEKNHDVAFHSGVKDHKFVFIHQEVIHSWPETSAVEDQVELVCDIENQGNDEVWLPVESFFELAF